MAAYNFFDRDLSWLSFNERVLSEAKKDTVPLLERIKFLSIYSSNLDEFYRVRMPALLALQKINKEKEDLIYTQAAEMINAQQNMYGTILTNSIIPALKEKGYTFLYNEPVPEYLKAGIRHYFFTQIAGFLQPVLLTKELDFFPENNQLYLAVVTGEEEKLFLLNVPCDNVSRFLKISETNTEYIVFLEDIIKQNLSCIFKDVVIKGAYNIKITRDAELDLQDEYDEDIAEKIEKQLSKRDHGFATRFLYEPEIPLRHLQMIVETFNLHKASVVQGGRHHNLKDLATLPLNAAGISYPSWPSLQQIIKEDDRTSLFDRIATGDRMINAPYQSYDTILRFFNEAAIDETVEEVYTTLYRVASDSKIVQALISAAKNGKRVTVLVELKARFDEANNIRWAKRMKAAGVKIIYSSNALKVHAKIALVKRRHAAFPYLGLLATGNLNETTARFYTDHILLTAYKPMLIEMEWLFAFLNKRKKPGAEDSIVFKHLLVAQFNLQAKFIELIDREIKHAKANLPAAITIKMNNLEEEVLISKLYEASQAGVTIHLIIRGICRLIPGIVNQSENIFIKRIVDRYLEHGRVFIFHNNGGEEVFMGSADWMNRNIYRRIEVCFPVYDTTIRTQLKQIIALQWQDNVQAVWIDEKMSNAAVSNGDMPVRSQQVIYELLSSEQKDE